MSNPPHNVLATIAREFQGLEKCHEVPNPEIHSACTSSVSEYGLVLDSDLHISSLQLLTKKSPMMLYGKSGWAHLTHHLFRRYLSRKLVIHRNLWHPLQPLSCTWRFMFLNVNGPLQLHLTNSLLEAWYLLKRKARIWLLMVAVLLQGFLLYYEDASGLVIVDFYTSIFQSCFLLLYFFVFTFCRLITFTMITFTPLW